MPFSGDTFTHLFDWEKDPQRQEKIINARLEAEFDGVDTGLSALASGGVVYSGLLLASGAAISWNSGNITITHGAGTLTFSGSAASRQYVFATGTNANGVQITGTGTETAFVLSNQSAAGKVYNFNSTGTGSGGPYGTGAFEVYNATDGKRVFGATSAGSVVTGAAAGALATNATDGFLYIPTCAGTPTGTPTSVTGMAPLIVNTTNNKLYFYSGGAWRDAGP